MRVRHDLPGRFRRDGGRLVRHGKNARGDLQETPPRRPGGGQRLGPLRVGLSFPLRRLGLSQLGAQAIRRRPLPGQRGFPPHGGFCPDSSAGGSSSDPSATIRRKRPTSSSISVARRWPTTRRPRSREFRWAASRPTRGRMSTWPCWAATNACDWPAAARRRSGRSSRRSRPTSTWSSPPTARRISFPSTTWPTRLPGWPTAATRGP